MGHHAPEGSSDLQGPSRNFKDPERQLAGRPPPLTRAVSWMVEEKKISEEKDEGEDEEEKKVEREEKEEKEEREGY